ASTNQKPSPCYKSEALEARELIHSSRCETILAFAHCLVKYSSPDFGEFAAFLKNSGIAECFTHSRGVDGAGLSTPSPRPRCLVQRSLSFGESGKLRSLPFLCRRTFQSKDLVLHKMAERGHGAYIRGIGQNA
ncbi:hypothetical protein TNCT_387181, partial [Trichonephila clavata]